MRPALLLALVVVCHSIQGSTGFSTPSWARLRSTSFSLPILPSPRTRSPSSAPPPFSLSLSASASSSSSYTRRSALGLLIAAPAVAAAQPTAAPPRDAASPSSPEAPLAKTPSLVGVEGGSSCDQSISFLRNKETGSEVFLIGTAHVSQLSAELVRDTIRRQKPDTVMIELDKKRIKSSMGAKREEPQSVWQLLRSEFGRSGPSFGDKIKGFESGLIGMVIGGLYKKLNEMGFSSGQEFVVAVQEARALNATLVLGDRGVDQTLQRLQESLDESGWGAVKSFASVQSQTSNAALIASEVDGNKGLGGDKESLEKTIESLKERETVRELMATLKQSLPKVYQALIAERDEFMSNSLLKAGGKRTVAVVGMAHLDGIEAYLQDKGYAMAPCSL